MLDQTVIVDDNDDDDDFNVTAAAAAERWTSALSMIVKNGAANAVTVTATRTSPTSLAPTIAIEDDDSDVGNDDTIDLHGGIPFEV
jgi:phage gp46-like protein